MAVEDPAEVMSKQRASAPGAPKASSAGSQAGRKARAASARAERAVYVISVAAELAGVHPQTLRIYERKGLLDPARTGGGSRRYSEGDIERLKRIQMLTNAGVNLEGVRRVMELEAEVERLAAELARARGEAKEMIERIHRHYRRDLVPLKQSPVRYRGGLA